MRALAHQQVSEVVNGLLAETPPVETRGNFFDLQLSLVRKTQGCINSDLVKAAIQDAWFIGYWSLKTGIQPTDESARNLVAPATVLQDGFWRRTKQELSTAAGSINPAFMDLSPKMIDTDALTGITDYNTHAERIISRNLENQLRIEAIRLKDSIGCPHGVMGMSRFLLQYLEFMTTHVNQLEPVLATQ
ncbi:MAG: hypothetical protein M3Q79_00675 [bacterium]|nr:hypothetical protein [bacterium]